MTVAKFFRVTASACLASLLWAAQSALAAAAPMVEQQADGSVKVGEILVAADKRSFQIAGTVLSHDMTDAPMEFIAVSQGGMKSYEALLELNTSATNFNMACILLGLDESNAKRPKHHFDPEEVLGDRVALHVEFQKKGKTVRVPVEELVQGDGTQGAHEWVYTGSTFLPTGEYLAQSVGTLIGFVHDPESIIQHRRGMGLGNYGAVIIDAKALPAAGTAITLILSRP